MKIIAKIVFLSLVIISAVYLVVPTPGLPPPPPKSLISAEPADTESIYRKAYYTNLSRGEIMAYYQQYFGLSLRLNHPPEDGYPLIRDQTMSSWLEELVHLWKDNLYINGFYPIKPTEVIIINSVRYQAKITVRYIPSHPITRLTVLALASISLIFLIKEYAKA